MSHVLWVVSIGQAVDKQQNENAPSDKIKCMFRVDMHWTLPRSVAAINISDTYVNIRSFGDYLSSSTISKTPLPTTPVCRLCLVSLFLLSTYLGPTFELLSEKESTKVSSYAGQYLILVSAKNTRHVIP